MLLFPLIISNGEDRVLFMLIHLTGVSCPSFKFSHLIKFCLPSQPECCLKSFLPIVPFFQQFRRQCVVDFIKYHPIFPRSCSIPSTYSQSAVQIMSFLLCPYLVLNRSVVSIIPLLTGVSSKCFLFGNFIFYAFHFQPKCYRN